MKILALGPPSFTRDHQWPTYHLGWSPRFISGSMQSSPKIPPYLCFLRPVLGPIVPTEGLWEADTKTELGGQEVFWKYCLGKTKWEEVGLGRKCLRPWSRPHTCEQKGIRQQNWERRVSDYSTYLTKSNLKMSECSRTQSLAFFFSLVIPTLVIIPSSPMALNTTYTNDSQIYISNSDLSPELQIYIFNCPLDTSTWRFTRFSIQYV